MQTDRYALVKIHTVCNLKESYLLISIFLFCLAQSQQPGFNGADKKLISKR